MATKIFLNLPIKNLEKSKTFFSALGYSFNPQFSDDQTACLVISEDIYAMLLTESRFQDFTPKTISDAHTSSEVLIALSAESRVQVDEMAEKALAAGGSQLRPAEDHGFMYGRSFNDLDGHVWEIFWMNPDHVQ
ncbi:MAG: VOC family protein [Saprospiraceae bacterium]